MATYEQENPFDVSTSTANTAGTAAGGEQQGQQTTDADVTTKISTEIPEQYKAANYAELIPEIQERMKEFRPLTEAQLEKLRRRRKAEGIVAGVSDAARSIANLIATHHYAPNIFDPTATMSAKHRERWEKDKAERDERADKYLNYAMMIGKLKGEDADRGFRAWATEQQLARDVRNHAEDVAYRNAEMDFRKQQHEDQLAQWQKSFDEGVRQFNVSTANERTRLSMESQRLSREMASGQMSFNLGKDRGSVTLTPEQLNAVNVSLIFNTLSQTVRDSVHGEAIKVKDGPVEKVEYAPPSLEAMLIAIGAHVGDENAGATREAIRQVAGMTKPAAY